MSDPVLIDRNSQLKPSRNAASSEQRPRRTVEVRLLGRFLVRINSREVVLPPASQRAVAYLAIGRKSVTRPGLAGALWPDSPSSTGLARLRNVLWKVKCLVPDLITSSGLSIALADHVAVDLHEARRVAHELLADEGGPPGGQQPNLLQDDLLVDWEEEWLDLEQRAFTVLRLRAMEKMARHSLEASRFYEAERDCRTVILAEPYRESARLLLADVYVAEGNAGLALQELVEFQRLLQHDLGVLPNDRIRHLTSAIRAGM